VNVVEEAKRSLIEKTYNKRYTLILNVGVQLQFVELSSLVYYKENRRIIQCVRLSLMAKESFGFISK